MTSYILEHKTIGFGIDPGTRQPTQGIAGSFRIPSYQRGYRWTRDEVTKLLDDIWDSDGKPYSLQPIVVKSLGNHSWELIDGQQRLTTLWILLSFMQKEPARYTLEYETRKGSQAYLQQIDKQQSNDNIDYFHIRQAHETIETWFADKMGELHQRRLIDEMFRFLSDSVRVIWYEVPKSEKAIPLFTRLNQGRIPLTDAELIKAVLLSQIQQDKPGRETEVAAQWDGIERDLQRAEIWAFVAPQNSHTQQLGTRIDLLLDTLAKKPVTDAHRYHTFDTLQGNARSNSLVFWDEVVALHAQIIGWFEEPRWHNKIGFLVACGVSIGHILQLAQGQGKQAFEVALTERIKKELDTKQGNLASLSYESHSDRLRIERLLLLFNVETCREHFTFKEHVGHEWSLEHIHAQNAQDLNRTEQWNVWLKEHKKALEDIRAASNTAAEIDEVLAEIETAICAIQKLNFGQNQFKNLAGKVLLLLNNGQLEEADHGIDNLALLSHGANAALSNAVFEVKRQKVLDMDKKGDYIPVATRNVFLKYYTQASGQQIHFWSRDDKKAYLDAIQDKLKDYLQ